MVGVGTSFPVGADVAQGRSRPDPDGHRPGPEHLGHRAYEAGGGGESVRRLQPRGRTPYEAFDDGRPVQESGVIQETISLVYENADWS